MHIVYFIGGPRDLSKQAVEHVPGSQIRVPIRMPVTYVQWDATCRERTALAEQKFAVYIVRPHPIWTPAGQQDVYIAAYSHDE